MPVSINCVTEPLTWYCYCADLGHQTLLGRRNCVTYLADSVSPLFDRLQGLIGAKGDRGPIGSPGPKASVYNMHRKEKKVEQIRGLTSLSLEKFPNFLPTVLSL